MVAQPHTRISLLFVCLLFFLFVCLLVVIIFALFVVVVGVFVSGV